MKWPGKLWRRKRKPAVVLLDRRVNPDDELMDWLKNLPPGRAAQIRNEAKWTRRQVADECGITSTSLVGKWEKTGSGWSRFSGLRYARLLKRLEAGQSVVNERTQL